MFEVTTCIAEPSFFVVPLRDAYRERDGDQQSGASSGLRWRGRTDATLLACCCDGGRPAATSVWPRVPTRLGQSLCLNHIFSMMLLVWVHLPSISSSLSKSRFNFVAHEPSSILSTVYLLIIWLKRPSPPKLASQKKWKQAPAPSILLPPRPSPPHHSSVWFTWHHRSPACPRFLTLVPALTYNAPPPTSVYLQVS